MSPSHCQELGQKASWLLIGYPRVNTTNQKPGQQVDPTRDNDNNSKISVSVEMPILKDVATVAFCDAQTTGEIHEKVRRHF